MVKAITLKDIPVILSKIDEDRKNGKKEIKNLLFLGNPMMGRGSTIERWFNEFSNDYYMVSEPVCLYKEERGILVKDLKDDKEQYFVYDNIIEAILKKDYVYCRRINYGCEHFKDVYYSFLKERKITAYSGHTIDISNNPVFIATGYTLGSDSATTDISNIIDLFDVYNVKADKQEILEYIIATQDRYIMRIKSNKDLKLRKDIEECENIKAIAKFIFNHPDFKFIEYEEAPLQFKGIFSSATTLSPSYIVSLFMHSDGDINTLLDDIKSYESLGKESKALLLKMFGDYKAKIQ